jgi:hypothetical protein
MLDSPLSDPRRSSGMGASGKAHAKPCVGFAAVGSGAPGPRATGMIWGATRIGGCPLILDRPLSGDMGAPPFGRLKLAANETCELLVLS